MSKQILIEKIEQKRLDLFKVASLHGLNSSEAIRYSQELDELLNCYNELYLEKKMVTSL
ncbi:aspartyl-phosphate phosphatase Spo0E family protein [Bacillus spongiae]|uniref:Aspartyl-phosphate phosphatase Spo0E family protein n=1 Tax=Bacillus spongiae TaxID=2683610 RepID=A0ABU8HBV8_9BACI